MPLSPKNLRPLVSATRERMNSVTVPNQADRKDPDAVRPCESFLKRVACIYIYIYDPTLEGINTRMFLQSLTESHQESQLAALKRGSGVLPWLDCICWLWSTAFVMSFFHSSASAESAV